MHRAITSLLALVAGLDLIFCGCAAASALSTRPNIVFLLSDDHTHDALSSAGHPVVKTPNLDRIAREGVRFTHCFVPNPICTPARAAILTGQDNWTNGVYFFGIPINESSPLWPKQLASAGYETFYTGKWHNDARPEERGFTHGANIWLGGKYDHSALPVVQYGKPRNSREPLDAFSSNAFVDAAIEFLDARQRREATAPFCLYVSFTTPHDPWFPPRKYSSLYEPKKIPLPKNFMVRPPFKIHESFPELRDQRQVPFPRTQENVRQALSQYYGLITQMDDQIGRLLDKLNALNLKENTLVMFVGDHGYSLGSHGFVGKQCMYEEGIRTPLLVRFPPWRRATPTNDALVSLIDLFPTLCEAADIHVPKTVEGRSLRKLYQGNEKLENQRLEIYAAFHSPDRHHMSTRCIRTRRHKYIQHLLMGEEELFDLLTDPHELHDLSENPQFKTLRAKLQHKVVAQSKDTPQGDR